MNAGNGSALATVEPQAIATHGARRSEVMKLNERGIRPETMADLWLVAQRIAVSGLAPKGMEAPETIFVALEMGMELGLPLMSSLRNIAVINGRPSIWGDAALALVQSTGLMEDYDEYVEGEGDQMRGVVTSKRKGRSKPITTMFSVADAKRAGLWGKQGPWTQYAPRMLKLRARGFNLRDNFPDVLQGLYTAEEAKDIPADPVVQVSAVPNPLNKLNAKLAETKQLPNQFNHDTGEVIDAETVTPTQPEPPSSDAPPPEAPESMAADPSQSAAAEVELSTEESMDAVKAYAKLESLAASLEIPPSQFEAAIKKACQTRGGFKKVAPAFRRDLFCAMRDGTFDLDAGSIRQ